MLDILTSHSYRGNARALPRWRKFIDILNGMMDIRRKQFLLAEPHHSGIVRLLTSLLWDVDANYLLNMEDDLERLFRGVFQRGDLRSRYDSVGREQPFKKLLYSARNSPTTMELMVPSGYKMAANEMPLGLNWAGWEHQHVPPLSVLSYNTTTLPRDLIGDSIRTDSPPAASVLGLNLPVLIIMWCKWYEKENAERDIVHPNTFIHKHVIPPLYNQIADLWILGLLDDLSRAPDRDRIDWLTEKWSEGVLIPEQSLKQGLQEICDLFKEVRNRSVKPDDIMQCRLFVGGASLMDLVHRRTEEQNIPEELLDYKPAMLMAEWPFAELILNLHDLYGSTKSNERVLHDLDVEMGRIKRQRLANRTNSGIIRDELETLLENMNGHILL